MSVRRTWDKDYYSAKARERLEGDDYGKDLQGEMKTNYKIDQIDSKKVEFQPAEDDADGPIGSQRAFLKARETKIDLESKVGKIEIIKAGDSNSSHGPGYWCEVCQCLSKDSLSYIDHCNGKKRLLLFYDVVINYIINLFLLDQRALGFSMRVRRVGVDEVKERLEALKRKVSQTTSNPKPSAIEEYEERLADRVLLKEKEKRLKKEQLIQQQIEKDSFALETIDPEIADMMGFQGFGSSKK